MNEISPTDSGGSYCPLRWIGSIATPPRTGPGSLMQGDESFLRVSEPRQFSFSGSSRYKAFRVGDRQVEAIRQYEERFGIPVHYPVYHPLTLPYPQVVRLMPTATLPNDG